MSRTQLLYFGYHATHPEFSNLIQSTWHTDHNRKNAVNELGSANLKYERCLIMPPSLSSLITRDRNGGVQKESSEPVISPVLLSDSVRKTTSIKIFEISLRNGWVLFWSKSGRYVVWHNEIKNTKTVKHSRCYLMDFIEMWKLSWTDNLYFNFKGIFMAFPWYFDGVIRNIPARLSSNQWKTDGKPGLFYIIVIFYFATLLWHSNKL